MASYHDRRERHSTGDLAAAGEPVPALRAQWLIATPDVIPGGRTECAIDLRFLQLASDN
jgi:hypothetical protein